MTKRRTWNSVVTLAAILHLDAVPSLSLSVLELTGLMRIYPIKIMKHVGKGFSSGVFGPSVGRVLTACRCGRLCRPELYVSWVTESGGVVSL